MFAKPAISAVFVISVAIALALAANLAGPAMPAGADTPGPVPDWGIDLTAIGITAPEGTGPSTSPVAAPPGGQVRLWYRVSNPYDAGTRVRLSAYISAYGIKYFDATGAIEADCELLPQSSNTCSRVFNIPGGLGYGPYWVSFGLGLPPGSTRVLGSSYAEGPGWLVLAPPAGPTATATTTPTPTARPLPTATPTPALLPEQPLPEEGPAPEPDGDDPPEEAQP